MLNSGKLKKILLVKVRGIGDAVLLTPSIRTVKEKFPDAKIVVLTSILGSSILENNPYLDEILIYDRNQLKNPINHLSFLNKIRRKKFDLAINFHASFRSALLVYFSGAKLKIVHNHSGRNYFSNIEIFAEKKQKSAIERDFDCLRALGVEPVSKETKIYLSESEKDFGKKFLHNLLAQNGTVPKFKFIGLNPGANRPCKRWIEERFAELADRIIDKYNSEIIIFSGPKEEYIADKIIKLMKNKAYLIKNLNLREVASIIKECNLLIGNDNGLFHIAVALGVSTITIFGPENPVEWHPYDHLPTDKHIIISRRLPCMNCGRIDCETNECINLITVAEVFEKI